jgi:single-strand DNA-binding protein
MSLNKAMIIGNLGKDPEKKTLPSGMSVTNFSVAVNNRKKQGDNWVDETEWFSVVCFDRLADRAADWLKKGSKVYVEGRLQTRSWDDKESGQKKYRTELIAQTFENLTPKPGSAGDGGSASSGASSAAPAGVPADEELPF